MNLADAIADEERNAHKGPVCGLATVIAGLDAKDRAALEAALISPMTSAALSRALAAAGHRVSGDTLRRHRRGECACG